MSLDTETVTVRREPDAVVTQHHVASRGDSSWAYWVAGVAVFAAVLVIALFVLSRNDAEPNAELLTAQAEAEAARLTAEQAVADANQARLDAATTSIVTSQNASQAAAAASAAAAQNAADRADAAARAASTPVIVSQPSQPDAVDTSEAVPPAN